MLTGELVGAVEHRRTPAGVPISRFTLRHRSHQTVAGFQRELSLSIAVVAAGEGFPGILTDLEEGRRLRVSGSLARAGHRSEERHLVLHAERIERLD